MNRQIKFRAWDEQNNVMHYEFQFIKSGNTGSDWIIFTSDKQALSSKEHPFKNPYFQQQFKIMQFTGLHDYDGKEIYEGDIMADADPHCEECADSQKIVSFGVSADSRIGWLCGDDARVGIFSKKVIIGNIHQNPELLK